MEGLILLNKKQGETPLACLERYRAERPEYAGVKMTYAGRLDPMAEGLLIVLAGDMVHKKDEFSGLPKTYECVMIEGVETDTYDVLGIPKPHPQPLSCKERGAEQSLQEFVGTFDQEYPPYSSKTVGGRQLHELARNGALPERLPVRRVAVSAVSGVSETSVPRRELVRDITDRISRASGDFRQESIIEAWKTWADADPNALVRLISFTIDVSGGTYIRGIVHEWGLRQGTGACLLGLKRTNIGKYSL